MVTDILSYCDNQADIAGVNNVIADFGLLAPHAALLLDIIPAWLSNISNWDKSFPAV